MTIDKIIKDIVGSRKYSIPRSPTPPQDRSDPITPQFVVSQYWDKLSVTNPVFGFFRHYVEEHGYVSWVEAYESQFDIPYYDHWSTIGDDVVNDLYNLVDSINWSNTGNRSYWQDLYNGIPAYCNGSLDVARINVFLKVMEEFSCLDVYCKNTNLDTYEYLTGTDLRDLIGNAFAWVDVPEYDWYTINHTLNLALESLNDIAIIDIAIIEPPF